MSSRISRRTGLVASAVLLMTAAAHGQLAFSKYVVPGAPVVDLAYNRQEAPSAVWDGTSFLHVWIDQRHNNGEVYAARVKPNGEILDPIGVKISDRPAGISAYSVGGTALARGITSSLAVWYFQSSPNPLLLGRLINDAGQPIGASTVIATCGANDCKSSPRVAFDGSNYFVAWDADDVLVTRVSPANNSLTVLDATPIVMPSLQSSFPNGISCDPTYCLVAWGDGVGGGAARVTRAGVLVDTTKIVLVPPVSPFPASNQPSPSTVWNGTHHAILRGTTLVNVSPAGVVDSTLSIGWNPIILGFDGTNYHLFQGDNIHRVVDGTTGSTLTSTPLGSSNYTAPLQASLACAGGQCLQGWVDNRAGGGGSSLAFDIYTARLGTDGTLLDPTGGVLLSKSGDRVNHDVSVTSNGAGQGLLVWQDDRGRSQNVMHGAIRAARFDSLGNVLDATPIELSPVMDDVNTTDPRQVAAGGASDYLVVYTQDQQVWGRRVSGAGAVLDAAPFLISDGVLARSVNVVFDGANYAVFWSAAGRGRFTRVSPAGVVLDVPSVPLPVPPDTVAFNGTNHLVVWTDTQTPTTLRAIRLDKTGISLDDQAFIVSSGIGNRDTPAAASDGKEFLVAWRDARNGSPTAIYGARVAANGTVTDANGFKIAESTIQKPTTYSLPGIGWSVKAGAYLVTIQGGALPQNYVATTVTPAGVVGPLTTTPVASGSGFRRTLAPMSGSKMAIPFLRIDPAFDALRAQAMIVDLDGMPDGGAPDGGSSDGGASEAGSGADGGSSGSGGTSGGPSGDGAVDGGTGLGDDSDCSCRTVGGTSNLGAFGSAGFALGLVAFVRRRRSRHA